MVTIVHFFLSTLGQEEDQAGTKHIFNLAEENFFRHRLTTLYPKIDEEGIKSASIGFPRTAEVGKLSLFYSHRKERL